MFSTRYRFIQWIELSTFGQLGPEFQFFMALSCKLLGSPAVNFPPWADKWWCAPEARSLAPRRSRWTRDTQTSFQGSSLTGHSEREKSNENLGNAADDIQLPSNKISDNLGQNRRKIHTLLPPKVKDRKVARFIFRARGFFLDLGETGICCSYLGLWLHAA